jgi:hypothetical protein
MASFLPSFIHSLAHHMYTQVREERDAQVAASEMAHRQDRDLLLLHTNDVEVRYKQEVERLHNGWSKDRLALDEEQSAHVKTKGTSNIPFKFDCCTYYCHSVTRKSCYYSLPLPARLEEEKKSEISKMKDEFESTVRSLKSDMESERSALETSYKAKVDKVQNLAQESISAAQEASALQHTRRERRHRTEIAQLELKHERAVIDLKEVVACVLSLQFAPLHLLPHTFSSLVTFEQRVFRDLRCIFCVVCASVCPKETHDEFERNMEEVEGQSLARAAEWKQMVDDRNNRIEELLASLRRERDERTTVEVALARVQRTLANREDALLAKGEVIVQLEEKMVQVDSQWATQTYRHGLSPQSRLVSHHPLSLTEVAVEVEVEGTTLLTPSPFYPIVQEVLWYRTRPVEASSNCHISSSRN